MTQAEIDKTVARIYSEVSVCFNPGMEKKFEQYNWNKSKLEAALFDANMTGPILVGCCNNEFLLVYEPLFEYYVDRDYKIEKL